MFSAPQIILVWSPQSPAIWDFRCISHGFQHVVGVTGCGEQPLQMWPVHPEHRLLDTCSIQFLSLSNTLSGLGHLNVYIIHIGLTPSGKGKVLSVLCTRTLKNVYINKNFMSFHLNLLIQVISPSPGVVGEGTLHWRGGWGGRKRGTQSSFHNHFHQPWPSQNHQASQRWAKTLMSHIPQIPTDRVAQGV